MFKGMKKVLAGILAAALALTPVSSVAAATSSPVISLGAVTKKNNTPYYKAATKQILKVDTANDGLCSIQKANPAATAITYTALTVNNGKYYYVNEKGKKVATGEIGAVQYKVARINKGAFVGATKVKKIVLGSSFRTLDYKSFAGARSLKRILLKSTYLKRVNKSTFGNLDTSNIVVYVPKATTAAQLKRLKEQFHSAGIKYSNIRRTSTY